MPTYSEKMYEMAILISAILFGFLMTAILGRVRREVETADAGQKPMLSWADAIALYVTMPALAIGGLMLPLCGLMLQIDVLQKLVVALTGFGVLLAAFYPLALASHYELSLGKPQPATGERRSPTAGEAFMVVLSLLVAIGWAGLTLR